MVAGSGNYSLLVAPMLWEGRGIGTIHVVRVPPRPYTEKDAKLLKTFADQAVIAIQNARLFNETKSALHKLEQRTSELGESLETQTAISQVLRVISESPTDVAPVFEAIMDSGMRLFQSQLMAVFRYDGRLIHIAAHRNWSAEALAQAQTLYPMPADETTLAGRVILGGKAIAVDDTQAERHSSALLASLAKTGGWRRMIIAPMLKDGHPVGTVHVAWRDPGLTPQRQIELLQTFADQAVIAIENVRLLNETKEALEQQTATAEILQVIAGSPDDVQPVLDAIVNSARKLVGGFSATAWRVMGEHAHLAAFTTTDDTGAQALREIGALPVATSYLLLPLRTREPQIVVDVETEAGLSDEWRELAHKRGYRSMLGVPLLHQGAAIGLISVTRKVPGDFPPRLVELLKTFARPGGDRHRERAPVQRDQGRAGAADGHRVGAARAWAPR